MKRTILATCLAASVAFQTSSVSASGTSHSAGENTRSAVGVSGNPADITRTIEITMQDNYFEPGEIRIATGETIRFVIRNAGEFVHEFNIGLPENHAAHQQEMLMMVEHGVLEPDRINHGAMAAGDHGMSHNDPNSLLLEPGKTGEIVWTFGDATTIEYACNVPGHYDSGMVGRFGTKHGS